MANISFLDQVSTLLQTVAHPVRLQILLAIGEGEACVCHLEAVLGYRQAYISQHLMALREAGLLDTRREGKYVFYVLKKLDILDLLQQAGNLAGIDQDALARRTAARQTHCECPTCAGMIPVADTATGDK
ncbi:MAG: helix-turn-helix transcriptional regulator [Anaerolineae bacterium]|nr:helix-turn-helix transcriptional regulator [Anaerolineae bacterium]